MEIKMKELKWGETPFHKMSHEELLQYAIKTYPALLSAQNAMGMYYRIGDQPFWQNIGAGGKAFKRVHEIIKDIHSEYDEENIYFSFYRYAYNFLFEESDGWGTWYMCSKCGQMCSDSKEILSDKMCKDIFTYSDCDGVMRKLTLDDLKPKEGENDG
jgi:hypothetical protein